MGSKQKLELLCTFNLNLCKILFVTPRLFFFSNSVKSYQFRRGLLDIKFWHLFRQIGFILQFYLITFVSQLPSERERLLSAEVCQSVSKEKQEKNRTRRK